MFHEAKLQHTDQVPALLQYDYNRLFLPVNIPAVPELSVA